MTVPTLLLPLNGDLSGQGRNGAITATGTGAVRYAAGRWPLQPEEEATINYAANPRLGTNSAGWGVWATSGSVISGQRVNTQPDMAPWVWQMKATTVGSAGHNFGGSYTTPTLPTLTGVITPSALVKASRTMTTVRYETRLMYSDSTFVGTTSTATTLSTTAVRVVFPTATPDPTKTLTSVMLYVWIYSSAQVGDTIYVTKAQVENKDHATPYCDGSLGSRCAWTGTPDASSSTRTAARVAQAVFVEEATTNLVLNPRFVSGARWTAGSSTLVQDTAVTEDGVPSAKVTITTVSGSTPYLLMADYPAVAPGEQLAFSCRMRGSRTGLRTGWQVLWRDASGTSLGAAIVAPSLTTTTAWQTMTWVSPVAPANTASAQILIRMELGSPTLAVGDIFWYCKPQVEKKTHATSYTDGTLGTGYAWTGTVNASTSTRGRASASVPAQNLISSVRGSWAFWYMSANVNNILASAYMLTVGVYGVDDFLAITTPARPSLWVRVGGNTAITISSSATISSGQWTFVYAEWDGTAIAITTNGDPLVTGTRNAPMGLTQNESIYFGADRASTQQANITLGPVLVFDRPLTDGERTNLYQSTSPWTFNALYPAIGGLIRVESNEPLAMARISRDL